MRIFSVILGKSRIEFGMYMVHGKYQARINGRVMFESTDWELVRATVMDSLASNHAYVGVTH